MYVRRNNCFFCSEFCQELITAWSSTDNDNRGTLKQQLCFFVFFFFFFFFYFFFFRIFPLFLQLTTLQRCNTIDHSLLSLCDFIRDVMVWFSIWAFLEQHSITVSISLYKLFIQQSIHELPIEWLGRRGDTVIRSLTYWTLLAFGRNTYVLLRF